jgi:UDP-glucose:(heptosyl)LPS alpha-1,3-glucosyltransferase
VLFLGTGYYRKGLDRVLQAFPALLRREPRARLLVVGYDSNHASFARHAATLDIAARVCFLGGRRDAEACFAAADLYVLPTRYDPFANSTLEALAAGLPVITTAANGASEILTAGVDGTVLAADAPPRALADALLLWSDRDLLRRGAHAARSLAERYPEQQTVETSRVLLEQVAKEKC